MRQYIKYFVFLLIAALWTTICFVAPDFLDSPTDSMKSVMTIVVYITALGIMQFLLLNIICFSRWLCTFLLPVYAAGGAVISYYRVAYNATITPAMVDVTFHTNMGTVAGVVSWELVLWVVVNILIAIGLVVWRFKFIQLKNSLWFLLGGMLLLSAYYLFNNRLHQSINQRYPMNIIVSVGEYWRIEKERGKERIMPEIEVMQSTDSIDMVIVIGEAMRADHLSLNGYERPTCPLLTKRTNVVPLPHIFSEYSYTTASVPHILTPADSINPERAYYNSSLIRCLSEQGYSSAWISNQDYGRTYSAFISEADTAVFPNADKSVFVFHPWYDEDLISVLDSLMSENTCLGSTHNLYVLHTIGSHWYYDNHVPESFQLFHPLTTARVAKQNTTEQMRNSYDNTVLYLDYILNEIIGKLEQRTAVLFYLSDHGEALGEDGFWLHANDAPATHRPAALVWYSDNYAALFPDKVVALKNNSTIHYRTDYLFYSVLSAAGIEAEGNNAAFDIFYAD